MSDGGRHRVMVVDDNPVVRSGLTALLEASGDMDVVAEAGDGRNAVERAWQVMPDVVLLDVRMPRVDGVSAAQALSKISRVIMLTHIDEPEVVLSAIRNGAVGYLVHDTFTVDELLTAIRETVHQQAHPLSPAAVTALIDEAKSNRDAVSVPSDRTAERTRFGLSVREEEVMDLVTQGHTNRDIALRLFLTEKTVKNHLNRIYTKLGVPNRASAIATWLGVLPGAER
ncbi:response regulator [Actinomadura sp. HBU206391]|uniref:response regulator n=1 Tax=Actinomadura sp. HBU206391 TaxID=2731692 RepID=UPI00164F2BF4|nr:response regulator transcription factor [Actinomadura sp. HBU206391]MBC6460846.1 response regulator transcription factor [Actinomadura sp. HBU206391]